MTSHDAHYKHLESQGICVIEEMEQIMADFFPDNQVHAKCALNLALSSKYAHRAGSKEGESAQKDYDKMKNYEFRSLNGRWPWDVV